MPKWRNWDRKPKKFRYPKPGQAGYYGHGILIPEGFRRLYYRYVGPTLELYIKRGSPICGELYDYISSPVPGPTDSIVWSLTPFED